MSYAPWSGTKAAIETRAWPGLELATFLQDGAQQTECTGQGQNVQLLIDYLKCVKVEETLIDLKTM